MNWTIKGLRESAHLLTGTGYETAPQRTTGVIIIIIIITSSQVSLAKATYTLQLNTISDGLCSQRLVT